MTPAHVDSRSFRPAAQQRILVFKLPKRATSSRVAILTTDKSGSHKAVQPEAQRWLRCDPSFPAAISTVWWTSLPEMGISIWTGAHSHAIFKAARRPYLQLDQHHGPYDSRKLIRYGRPNETTIPPARWLVVWLIGFLLTSLIHHTSLA